MRVQRRDSGSRDRERARARRSSALSRFVATDDLASRRLGLTWATPRARLNRFGGAPHNCATMVAQAVAAMRRAALFLAAIGVASCGGAPPLSPTPVAVSQSPIVSPPSGPTPIASSLPISMPVAAGDQAADAFGLNPFGIHFGGYRPGWAWQRRSSGLGYRIPHRCPGARRRRRYRPIGVLGQLHSGSVHGAAAPRRRVRVPNGVYEPGQPASGDR